MSGAGKKSKKVQNTRDSSASVSMSGTGNSRLEEVQRKADDIKGVMHKNIELTLERCEHTPQRGGHHELWPVQS